MFQPEEEARNLPASRNLSSPGEGQAPLLLAEFNATNGAFNSTGSANQSETEVPPYMESMKTILVFLHLSVFVSGLMGNSLVCLSVYRNKSLQTVTNYYIVNLAIADFLVILICLPPTVYWDLNLTWSFGLVLCKLVVYLQSISVSVSVLTLTCISIDRWYAICRPLEFSSTKSRAKITILLVWFASMIFASPDAIFLTVNTLFEEADFTYTDCSHSWSESSQRIYQLCIVILLFVVPLLLMSISYSQIVNVLWRNETMTDTLQHSLQLQEERLFRQKLEALRETGELSAYTNQNRTLTSQLEAEAPLEEEEEEEEVCEQEGPESAEEVSWALEGARRDAVERRHGRRHRRDRQGDQSTRRHFSPPAARTGQIGAKRSKSKGLRSKQNKWPAISKPSGDLCLQSERQVANNNGPLDRRMTDRPSASGGCQKPQSERRSRFRKVSLNEVPVLINSQAELLAGNRKPPAEDGVGCEWPEVAFQKEAAHESLLGGAERRLSGGEQDKRSRECFPDQPAANLNATSSPMGDLGARAAAPTSSLTSGHFQNHPSRGEESMVADEALERANKPKSMPISIGFSRSSKPISAGGSGASLEGRYGILEGALSGPHAPRYPSRAEEAKNANGDDAAGDTRNRRRKLRRQAREVRNGSGGSASSEAARLADSSSRPAEAGARSAGRKYYWNLANYLAKRGFEKGPTSSSGQAAAGNKVKSIKSTREDSPKSAVMEPPEVAGGSASKSLDVESLAGLERGHAEQEEEQQQQQRHSASSLANELRMPPAQIQATCSNSSETRFCKLIESRKKAAKMLIVIVIMFALCYLPIHLINTLRYTIGLPQNDITTLASLLSHWLCYFNSAVNPLIYNLMSGKFRHEFANLFFCKFFKSNQRTSAPTTQALRSKLNGNTNN